MHTAIIYGAGGHARELKFQLEAADTRVIAFVDDFASGHFVEELPVLRRDAAAELDASAEWFVAIGDNHARAKVISSIRKENFALGSFISRHALVAPSARISHPAQIFANSVISAGAVVDENVIVNFGCVISHDVRIGANSYLAPGVRVAGNVTIGTSVWLGVGCTIKNGTPQSPLRIGDNVVIGASACVVNDIDAGNVAIGIPAKQKSRKS